MHQVPIIRKSFRIVIVFIAISSFVLGSAHAQETSSETPTATEVLVIDPTSTPEPLPVSTEEPTLVPNIEPTAITTSEPIVVLTSEPSPVVTDEPVFVPTVHASPIVGAPSWLLAFGADFEAGVPSQLGGAGWLSIKVDGGHALQNDVTVTPLGLIQPLLTSAIEVKAWINAGTLTLTLREQRAEFYRATIESSGAISLNRGALMLANTFIDSTAQSWHKWRLEAYDNTVTLSLDGVVVLSVQDLSPLGAGVASVNASSESALRIDDLAIYADVTVVIEAPTLPTDIPGLPAEETPPESAPLPGFPLPGAGTGPTITLPINNSVISQNSFSITWSAMPGATAYTLEWASDDAFTVGLVQIPGLTSTSQNTSLPDGTYYTRVQATAPVMTDYSPIVKFTIDTIGPVAPTLNAFPSLIRTMKPTFSWSPVSDAVKYYLDVSADGFSTYLPGYQGREVLTTSFTPTMPFPNQSQTLDWRVRAQDAAGNKGFNSSSDYFEMQLELTPEEGSTVTTSRPTFTWANSGVTGVTYTLEVHSGNAYVSPIFTKSGIKTTSYTMTVADPALYNGTLYWRVKASSDTASNDRGNSFIVNATSPAPTLTAPAHNAAFNVMPQLKWTLPAYVSSPNILSRLQVSETSDFSTLLVDAIAPSGFIPGLPDGVYYWRVAVVNNGTTGTYSAVRSFTIDTAGDNTPVVSLNPAHGTRISTVRPTFTWEAVTGTPGLVVQVDDDGDFSSGLLHTSVPLVGTVKTYTIPLTKAPLPQGVHYWRVVRRDALGNLGNPVGEGSQFTLFLGTTPAINAQVNTGYPAFAWAAAGTTPVPVYTLQIDNDSDFLSLTDEYPGLTVPALNLALLKPLPDALPDGVYYWRVLVNGITALDNQAFSFRVNTLPLPAGPVFSAPSTFATMLAPTISWSGVDYAVSYSVEISTSSTFATVPVTTFSVTDTNIDASDWSGNPLAALPADGLYFVRVRGKNSGDAFGPFSLTRAFTVDTVAPAGPSNLAPNSDTTPVTTPRPTFTWTRGSDPTTQILQIDDDGMFIDGVNGNEGDVYNTPLGAVAAFTLPPSAPALNQNQVYKWRVISVDAAGNRTLSAMSSVIVLLGNTPAAGTLSANGLATFTWTAVANTTGFHVQIDDDVLFGSPITLNAAALPRTAVSFTKTAPGIPPGYYFWRVMPVGGVYGTAITPRALVVAPGIKPVITTPINGSGSISQTQTITWTDTNALLVGETPVRQYKIELTGSTFSGSVLFTTGRGDTNDPLTYTLPEALTLDGRYTFRVAPLYASPTSGAPIVLGAFSDPVSVNIVTSAPNTSVLTGPLSDAMTSIRPTFSWTAADRAVSYRLELDADGDFGSGVLPFSVNAPATSFTIPASTYLRQGVWSWRLIAINAAGVESAASETRVLHAFAGLTPANDAFTLLVRPTFTWASVNGATGYTLEVSNNSSFSGTLAYTKTLGAVTAHAIPLASPPLSANTQFFWRVRPIGGAGDADAIDRSALFTTVAAPMAPALIRPTNGLTIWDDSFDIMATATLKNLTNATPEYQFEIAGSTLFNPVLVTQVTSTPTPTLPASMYSMLPGSYVVRVKACYQNGSGRLCSPYSATRVFTVVATPIVTLTSPISEAIPQTNRPTFAWAKIPNAVAYEVKIYEGMSTLYTSARLTTNSFTLPPRTTPLPQGILSWTVTAYDGVGLAVTSTPSTFRVLMATSPQNNNLVTTLQPTFTWKATAGATSYTLKVTNASSLVEYTFTGNTLSHTVPAAKALENDDLYFWHVTPNTQPSVQTAARMWFVTNTYDLGKPVLTPRNPNYYLDLDWSDLDYAPYNATLIEYNVQISAVPTFSSLVYETATGPFTSMIEDPYSLPLLNDGVYYVRVSGIYSIPYSVDRFRGPYSDVVSYIWDTTPPPVPVIARPAANAVVTTLRPTITWAAMPTATSYRVDMFSDSGNLVNNAIVNTPSFTPTDPLPQTVVYVRVRSVDAVGNMSGYSAIRAFRVFVGALPAAKAFTIDTTPTFSWVAQPGISTYALQIDSDGDFSTSDYEYSITGTKFTPTIPLPVGAYVWRVVKAEDISPNNMPHLLVISPTAALKAPSGITPTGHVSDLTPSITWTGVSLPGTTVTYELQLAPTAKFVPATLLLNEIGLTITEFETILNLSQGAKFVRVRAKYTVNLTGDVFFSAYTAPVTFNIDTIAPLQPSLTGPVQNALIPTTRTPTFTWIKAAGATTYRLEVDNNSDLESPLYVSTAATLARLLPGSLGLANGTYYWQVIAIDATGNETASAVRTFTIAVQ